MKGFSIRKHNMGKAIIRFLIGLLLVAVCVLLMYELVLKGDFNKNDKDVENAIPLSATVQPTPGVGSDNKLPIIKGSEKPTVIEDATGSEATLSEPEATPVPTQAPTPTPTPAPTPIPADKLSKEVRTYGKRAASLKSTGFKTEGGKLNIGITDFSISAGDGGKALTLTGWAYATDERFDGADCELYIVVLDSQRRTVFYQPTIVPGITGMITEDMGKNLDQCEFTAAIDVSWYPKEEYQIGVGIRYKAGGKDYRYAYTFGNAYNFRIVSGVITAVDGKEVS